MGRTITINNTTAGEIIDIQDMGSVIDTPQGVYAKPTTKLLKSDFDNPAVFDRLTTRLATEGNFIPQISTEPSGSTIGSFDSQQTVSSGTATLVLSSGISGHCDVFVVDSAGSVVIPNVAPAAKQYCSLADWDGTKFRLFYSSTNALYASVDSCKISTDGRTWTTQALSNFPNLKNFVPSQAARSFIGMPSVLGVQNQFPSYGVYWCGTRFIALGEDNTNGTLTTVKIIGASSTDGITWSAMPSAILGSSTNGGTLRIVGFNRDGNNATFQFNDGTTSSTSDGGVTWTANSEVGQVPYIMSTGVVSTANNKFFSINNTYVAYSDDGISWNVSNTFTSISGINSVAYGAGLYVSNCANDGYYVTSPDGITWTRRMMGARAGMVSASDWGNYTSNMQFQEGVFSFNRSSGSESYFVWSADGINWTYTTQLAVPYGGMWGAKNTYNGTQFVCIGNGTANAYSNDGKSWTLGATMPVAAVTTVGNNTDKMLYLPSSGSSYYTKATGSANTKTTEAYNANFPSGTYIIDWSPSASKFVAFNTTNGNWYTSSTGLANSWATLSAPITVASGGRTSVSIVASSSKIRVGPMGPVASQWVQSLAHGTNASSWTAVTTLTPPLRGTIPPPSFQYATLAHGSSKFLAWLSNAQYATSTDDGKTWTVRNFGSVGDGMSLVSITWCGTFFLASTQANTGYEPFLKSSDGITWTKPYLNRSIGSYTGVFYQGGRIFCGTYGNWSTYTNLYTSVNGTSDWTYLQNVYIPYSKYAGISYDGSRYYAPYSNSATQYHRSNNGYSSWSNTFTPSIPLNGVSAWANNGSISVARGTSGNGLLTSPTGDGETWTDTGEVESDVCYSTNKFLTASGLTSTNGTTWTSLGFNPTPPTNILTTGTGSYSFIGPQLVVSDGTSAPPPVTMAISSNYSSKTTHNVIRNPAVSTTTLLVTVANSGSGNKYYIDGTEQASLQLTEGFTYKFDQSSATNSGHPLVFSTTSDGTHGGGSAYTTGVTTVGTAGSSGAYTQIVVAGSAPTLYYYCSAHSGMGGTATTTAFENYSAKQIQILTATSTNFMSSPNNFQTFVYIDTTSMGQIKYIAYFGNIMVLITNTNSIYTSVNDGSAWVEQNFTTMMGTPTVVLCDANRLYLFTSTGEVFISTSGTSWTRRTLPASPTYPTSKSSLAAQSSNNVMVNGGDATINWVTSDAGVNWKASTATAGTGTLGITDGTAAYFYGNTNMSVTTLTDIAAGYYAVPKISATLPTATRNLTTYEKVE